MKRVLAAARAIVSSNSPEDETFIVRFISSDKIESVHEFTRDKDALLKVLKDFYTEGGQTAIIDALYVSADYLAQKRSNSGDGRRNVLVLITDGEERGSSYKLTELLTSLREKQIQVYSLAYPNRVREHSREKYEKALKLLNTLVQETGGKLLTVEESSEFEVKTGELINLLR